MITIFPIYIIKIFKNININNNYTPLSYAQPPKGKDTYAQGIQRQ